MKLPDIPTKIKDPKTGIVYVVLGYRSFSSSEASAIILWALRYSKCKKLPDGQVVIVFPYAKIPGIVQAGR